MFKMHIVAHNYKTGEFQDFKVGMFSCIGRGGEKLELIKPSIEFREAFVEAVEKYDPVDDELYLRMYGLALENFSAFLEKLSSHTKGIGLPDWHPPQSCYWLIRDGADVVGILRLRHELNERLEKSWGHIGFDLVPPERQKGYGSAILSLGLKYAARDFQLDRVMLICASTNLASQKCVLKNGGREIDEIDSDLGYSVKRYWVPTQLNEQ